MELLTTAITFLMGSGVAGGGILAYLKYFHDIGTERRSFTEAELEKYRTGFEALSQKVRVLELAAVPSPAPEWKKDSKRFFI